MQEIESNNDPMVPDYTSEIESINDWMVSDYTSNQ